MTTRGFLVRVGGEFMKLYIIQRNGIHAEGIYDSQTNHMKVLKGSILSEDVKHSATFKGANSIEKKRASFVVDRTLKEDVDFKSPSSAANFVTGGSSNGFVAWKNKDGIFLKHLISR